MKSPEKRVKIDVRVVKVNRCACSMTFPQWVVIWGHTHSLVNQGA